MRHWPLTRVPRRQGSFLLYVVGGVVAGERDTERRCKNAPGTPGTLGILLLLLLLLLSVGIGVGQRGAGVA